MSTDWKQALSLAALCAAIIVLPLAAALAARWAAGKDTDRRL